jgi:hypothetical protein
LAAKVGPETASNNPAVIATTVAKVVRNFFMLLLPCLADPSNRTSAAQAGNRS